MPWPELLLCAGAHFCRTGVLAAHHHHALPLDAHPAGDAGIDGMVGVPGVFFSIGSSPAEKYGGSVGPSTQPGAQPCNADSWWWRA